MLFDLLFVGFFLASIAALIGVGVTLIVGRRGIALRTAKVLVACWLIYLGIVALVAVRTPQRVLKMNEDLCFDEMCFAVVSFHHMAEPNGRFAVITIRVSSHSRGRPQSEGGIRARLWKDGTYQDASAKGHAAYVAQYGPTPELTQRLQPGQSVLSRQVFEMPRDPAGWAVALDHGFTPGYLVIGESPILHKPTVIEINQASSL